MAVLVQADDPHDRLSCSCVGQTRDLSGRAAMIDGP
jgi:hypothetical protein